MTFGAPPHEDLSLSPLEWELFEGRDFSNLWFPRIPLITCYMGGIEAYRRKRRGKGEGERGWKGVQADSWVDETLNWPSGSFLTPGGMGEMLRST